MEIRRGEKKIHNYVTNCSCRVQVPYLEICKPCWKGKDCAQTVSPHVCERRFVKIEGNILLLCPFCFKLHLENCAYLINWERTRAIMFYVLNLSRIKFEYNKIH